MIVIVDTDINLNGKSPKNFQTGVALLQVLLIGAVISLLAIRFTHTASDQVKIAESFENRVRAQLAAQSAITELVFLYLSDSIGSASSDEGAPLSLKKAKLNLYGEQVEWDEGVKVTVQDLNGLLPQIFPDHQLWPILLQRLSLPQHDIEKYLGTWLDFQDADNESVFGGKEPLQLESGHKYLDGFSQSDKVLRWVFADRPLLVDKLLEVSHIYASNDTNILNFPNRLLKVLFDPDTAEEIISSRKNHKYNDVSLRELLMNEHIFPNVFIHNSNRLKINVDVNRETAGWREEQIIYFSASREPPFKIILNN